MWYVYTVEYYSTIKKNNVLYVIQHYGFQKHYAKWKKTDGKDYMWYDKKGESMKSEDRLLAAWGSENGAHGHFGG